MYLISRLRAKRLTECGCNQPHFAIGFVMRGTNRQSSSENCSIFRLRLLALLQHAQTFLKFPDDEPHGLLAYFYDGVKQESYHSMWNACQEEARVEKLCDKVFADLKESAQWENIEDSWICIWVVTVRGRCEASILSPILVDPHPLLLFPTTNAWDSLLQRIKAGSPIEVEFHFFDFFFRLRTGDTVIFESVTEPGYEIMNQAFPLYYIFKVGLVPEGEKLALFSSTYGF